MTDGEPVYEEIMVISDREGGYRVALVGLNAVNGHSGKLKSWLSLTLPLEAANRTAASLAERLGLAARLHEERPQRLAAGDARSSDAVRAVRNG